MAANAWKYGWVMSYPKGKADVSCYDYEPWHYRYFGRALADEDPRQRQGAARVSLGALREPAVAARRLGPGRRDPRTAVLPGLLVAPRRMLGRRAGVGSDARRRDRVPRRRGLPLRPIPRRPRRRLPRGRRPRAAEPSAAAVDSSPSGAPAVGSMRRSRSRTERVALAADVLLRACRSPPSRAERRRRECRRPATASRVRVQGPSRDRRSRHRLVDDGPGHDLPAARRLRAKEAGVHQEGRNADRLRDHPGRGRRPARHARGIRAAGAEIAIRWAYRSYAEQQDAFGFWVRQSGKQAALQKSARPGHSEHQLGTAIDFRSADSLEAPWDYPDWATTPPGAWMMDNAWKYGFVLSYPQGQAGPDLLRLRAVALPLRRTGRGRRRSTTAA